MKLDKGDIHVEYAIALLQLLEEQGISRELALRGTGIQTDQLDSGGRLTTQQDAWLLGNAVRLTNDPGIGYLIGLHSRLTWHGMLGYGLMSCATLRDALELWTHFLDLRTTTFTVRLVEHEGLAMLLVHDMASRTPLRFCAVDRMMSMTTRLCEQLTQRALPELEVWHPGSEPLHYARYRKHMVTSRFETNLSQIRFPATDLDIPLPNANPSTLSSIFAQCERERARLRRTDDLVPRVMELLQRHEANGYPSLDETAKMLCVSSRTLKRKLQNSGLNFRGLVDDARKGAVLREVLNPALRMSDIALHAGYRDPASFTRAFLRWTGESPSHYRKRLLAEN